MATHHVRHNRHETFKDTRRAVLRGQARRNTMKAKFTRREFTTRGADPTVVVEWTARDTTDGTVKLQEFQGIIGVEVEPQGPSFEAAQWTLVQRLGEALHAALEHGYQLEQELADYHEQDGGNVPEQCPGCGCSPGDGRTKGCTHPDGCGYFDGMDHIARAERDLGVE